MSESVINKETFLMSMALDQDADMSEHISTSAAVSIKLCISHMTFLFSLFILQNEVRGRDCWRGNYHQVLDLVLSGTEEVGTVISPGESLKFFSVATNELVKETNSIQLLWFVIPTSWLSLDGRYLLYPPPDFLVSGKSPSQWKGKIFKRYGFPRSYWLESDLASIVNAEKPGKFILSLHFFTRFSFEYFSNLVRLGVAVKASLAATKGVSREEMDKILLSDSERAFGRNQRVHKKRKIEDVYVPAPVIANAVLSAAPAAGDQSTSLNITADTDSSSSESEEEMLVTPVHKSFDFGINLYLCFLFIY